MIAPRWTWALARATGTSHLKAGRGCDDSAACLESVQGSRSILVSVVSDGAGSASYSSIGSRIASQAFARCALGFLREGGTPSSMSPEIACEWLDDVRDRITEAAHRRLAAPRDFATTLVGTIVGPDSAAFFHVGDGSAVYRLEKTTDWTVASWPEQGEYAATTYFVTDDPAPHLRFSLLEGHITELALFSDGIERLVLDFSNQTAFAPFFDRMFLPLSTQSTGRDRKLSRHLKGYLDSPSVCDKTDDDKTLVLAKRVLGAE
jgi:serine/threonine protein phosphatase PrpC